MSSDPKQRRTYNPPVYKVAGVRSDSALWFARHARMSAEAHQWLHHAPGEVPEAHRPLLDALDMAAEEHSRLATQVGMLLYCARVEGWREWAPERRRWTRRRALDGKQPGE